MSNPSVFDKLTTLFQNFVAPGKLQSSQPQSSIGNDTSPDQSASDYSLHNNPSVGSDAHNRLYTKKTWELVIGGQHNINDEGNQVAQQQGLNQIALAQFHQTEEQTRAQLRKGW